MVISDFFHLRLGASVGGGGVPFPQVHLKICLL